MNSLYTYYNNVQKMAAYQQDKRMQRGVRLGYDENQTFPTSNRFVMGPVHVGTGDFSIEYYGNMFGSGFATSRYCLYQQDILNVASYSVGQNGVWQVLLCGDGPAVRYEAETTAERFLLTITRQGTTLNVYINGELKATKEQSEVKDLGNLQLTIANSSDVGFVRVWNMCLSADDVTAHYNNGDPMGYVVPKAERGIDYSVELTGKRTYTWDAENTSYLVIVPASPMYLGRMYKVNITVSNYETGTPFIYDVKYKVPAQNGTYDIVVKNISDFANRVHIFGGLNHTVRRLTLTVNSVTPVGLLAEYLPQNLMYGNDNKTIAVSWLDSAKQLPLSDEYMEPLFQSIGGYDMAANGAPEILYNE